MNSSSDIRKRIFLVGTARSGTTLLQSMLSAHPELFSLPETHFWRGTIPFQACKRLGKSFGAQERRFVTDFLERLQAGDLKTLLPGFTFSQKRWTRALLRILDQYTQRQGHRIWLEKTPMHLYYIDLIQAVDPNVYFVHNLRNGEDVVASLYDAGHKHPESFNTRSIPRCVRRWRREIAISRRYIGQPQHAFVRYEALVENPEARLRSLCKRIELPFRNEMLDYRREANRLRFPEETWKERNSDQIRKVRKFDKLFSPDEQEWIQSRVSQIDLGIFDG